MKGRRGSAEVVAQNLLPSHALLGLGTNFTFSLAVISDPDCQPGDCGQNAFCYMRDGGVVGCGCDEGYVKHMPTDTSCVHPCADSVVGRYCGRNTMCSMQNPGYLCSCMDGYREAAQGDAGRTDPDKGCVAIVESCTATPCAQFANCFPTGAGSRDCQCQNFYMELTQGDAFDVGCVHFCDTGLACADHAECLNLQFFGFVCICAPGFTGSHLDALAGGPGCHPLMNPCENACGPNADCTLDPITDDAVCHCQDGYEGDPYDVLGCDEIVDECAAPCGANADCYLDPTNERRRCVCREGYEGDPDSAEGCVLIEICRDLCPPNSCGPHANCYSVCSGGSVTKVCKCQDGFYEAVNGGAFNPADGCYDPCEVPVVNFFCGPNTICDSGSRSYGYECSCIFGHKETHPGDAGRPGVGCVPVTDSCAGDPCPASADCFTLSGDIAQCFCKPGFIVTPTGCDPLPCDPNPCPANADCGFFPGDERCRCQEGFEAVGGACVAIQNPCDTNPCSANQNCIRSFGNLPECVCKLGFTKTATGCEPLPCDPNPCPANADCGFFPGDERCRCQEGFEAVSGICVAIQNPCDTNPCSATQNCIRGFGNVPRCVCKPGFIVTSTGCEPPTGDPCVGVVCGPNADCCVVSGAGVCRCHDNHEETSVGSAATTGCVPSCGSGMCTGANTVCVPESGGGHVCKCAPGTVQENPGDVDGVGCKAKPSDPCQPNPCGSTKVCHGKSGFAGDFVCTCQPGRVEWTPGAAQNPSLLCVVPPGDPCNPGDCGPLATCIWQYGRTSIRVCKCNPGLVEDSSGNCVSPQTQPQCPCSSITCGANAYCAVQNSGGVCSGSCVCFPGYTGNPNTGCDLPGCTVPSTCPQTDPIPSNPTCPTPVFYLGFEPVVPVSDTCLAFYENQDTRCPWDYIDGRVVSLCPVFLDKLHENSLDHICSQ